MGLLIPMVMKTSCNRLISGMRLSIIVNNGDEMKLRERMGEGCKGSMGQQEIIIGRGILIGHRWF